MQQLSHRMKAALYELASNPKSCATRLLRMLVVITFFFQLIIYNQFQQEYMNTDHHQLGRLRSNNNQRPDGTLNGINIYYHKSEETPLHSSAHCVGENYQDTAWIHKSCSFQNLCFDMEAKEYVLFRSREQEQLEARVKREPLASTAFTMQDAKIAIGGVNPQWSWESTGVPRMKWFPQILSQSVLETDGYYQLESDVVWVPFHSLAGFNPGHLVWDDLLPIYTLLSMFQMLHGRNGKRLLLTRYVLDGEPLWATCDSNDKNKQRCMSMFDKFLPLMGVFDREETFTTNQEMNLVVPDGIPRSKYVCASQGAAGLGMLTDHGIKQHGREPPDYETTHNIGRGAMLYSFRNFMLQNINMPNIPLNERKGPLKITFSIYSSHTKARATDFAEQLKVVQNHFWWNRQVIVESHFMQNLSLEEQVRIATESSIFVTVCGGGAVTATFLPQGSSLFVFYEGHGAKLNGEIIPFPARLDWDMVNNMSYLRAHWVPLETKDVPDQLNFFVDLVQHEVDTIMAM